MQKKDIWKAILNAFVAFLTALLTVFGTSCSLGRTVTTSSEYHHRGDTSVVIQTKTIERYDGRKLTNEN